MPRARGQTQYNEPKTAALYAALTPTGLQGLDQLIYRYNPQMSRSEFLERLGRQTLDPERFQQVFFASHKR